MAKFNIKMCSYNDIGEILLNLELNTNQSITNNGTKGQSIARLKLPVDIAKMQEVLKIYFTYIVSNIFKL